MQEQHRKTVKSIWFVIIGLAFLILLASGAQTWAAPPSQGSVPPPPTKVGPPPPPPPPPPAIQPFCCLPGVSFSSRFDDGNEDIFVMRSDGSGTVRLTDHPAIDRYPAPSPDGLRIAFISNRDDPDYQNCGKAGKPNCIFHIYVIDVDGQNLRRVTEGEAADGAPNWAADNAQLVFASTRNDPDPKTCGQAGKPNCVSHLFVVKVDAANTLTRLTENPPVQPPTNPPTTLPISDDHPNWSPDASRIAFDSTRDDPDPKTCGQTGKPNCIKHVYTLNLADKSLTRLTTSPVQDGHPAWSVDSLRLAFHTNRDDPNPLSCTDCLFHIYTMNADGTNQLVVYDSITPTKKPLEGVNPIWIPGCVDRLVFASKRDGNVRRVFAINPDYPNDLTRLTTLPVPNDTSAHPRVEDDLPAWSGLPPQVRASAGTCCTPGIAFDRVLDPSKPNGNRDIFIMKSDGSYLTQLTFDSAVDMHPAPSPDGKRIAFVSNRSGSYQIYMMNIDGSGVVRMTDNQGDDGDPAWSNDGKYIAFSSSRDDPKPWSCGKPGNPACVEHIYTIPVGGELPHKTATRLTDCPPNTACANTHPNWSLSGSRIVFDSNRDGNNEIYVMNADGTNPTRLTNNPADDGHPSFSTDAGRIAFESNRADASNPNGHYRVFIMSSDGTNQHPITNGAGKVPQLEDDRAPYWCPSCNERITYYSNRDGVFSIYTIQADGTNQVRVTVLQNGPVYDELPAWSGVYFPWLPRPSIVVQFESVPMPTPTPGATGGGGVNVGDSWLSGIANWLSRLLGGH